MLYFHQVITQPLGGSTGIEEESSRSTGRNRDNL